MVQEGLPALFGTSPKQGNILIYQIAGYLTGCNLFASDLPFYLMEFHHV